MNQSGEQFGPISRDPDDAGTPTPLENDDRAPAILFVLPGIDAGGSERVVNVVANHWAARGWRIAIATFADAATPSYYGYAPGVTLHRLGLPPGPAGPLAAVNMMLRRIIGLRRVMQKARPSLVISFLTRTNILALIAGTGLPMPIVVSERNNPALQPIGTLWRLARGLFYPRAFGLVTMTQGARDHFPPRMRRRSWVIPNPADLPDRQPHRDSTGKTIVAVGRLVEQKGFDILLEAFARIAPKHPGWTLRIWGEGPDRAALEAQRDRLGLADRIEMPGVTAVPAGWIDDADIFVLSSRYEGWGIVLLEAMAAGLPVASFDCQWGPRDMITDGVDGLIVPHLDITAMAATLDQLITDPALRRRLGNAARQSTERFAPDRIVAQWGMVVRAALTPATSHIAQPATMMPTPSE